VLAAAGLGVLYAALLVAVVADSPLVDLDSTVLGWAPATQWPGLLPVLSVWVLLGQRAVCLAVAVAWLGARAVRTGDPRPLLTLGVTTLLLDVSVEGVKTALGRQGPLELGRAALAQGGSVVFDGGTIFPSGHTANAVVTWGLLALLARRHRRVWGVLAGLVAVSVGLTTVYLGTHWLSDVLAGWAAGGLVLLAVPALGPVVDRLAGPAARSLGHLRRLRCAPAAGGCGASGARIDR
jgi:undecaprenyl-diphosphatase